jgi:pyruvate dehydrogenase E1 component
MASTTFQLEDQAADRDFPADYLAALDAIQRRVLWLATYMVHHANHIRPNLEKLKVGGHQASSASVVTILTVLYFHILRAGDRVAIKPHAAPAFHAIQYLLGALPRSYLTELRSYKGLQAYPSRTKDPDPVDFSTGSVGLGAVAPAFAALAHRYAEAHFGGVTSRRFVALAGDAELDEGNVWEAAVEPALQGLGNILWIVDLNRQSLDRIVPGIRAAQLKRLFADTGWQVLEAKYGVRLQELFARPGGAALRRRIDDMSNEEYQHLIRLDGAQIRERLPAGRDRAALARLIASIPDADLPGALANLGGHDLLELLRVFAAAEAVHDRPTVLFAYTIKGWGLPIAGDQLNHAALLTPAQTEALAPTLGADLADPWAALDPGSPAGRLCAEAAVRLCGSAPPSPTTIRSADVGIPPAPGLRPAAIPSEVIGSAPANTSTQEMFGRVLMRLAELPEVGKRIVTTSPDVSISTNLAGWINKTGVFAPVPTPTYDGDEGPRLLRWRPGPGGQHIELGISEMNLFMLLGQLGLAAELCGQLLLPVGTVYDPFVCRGLDALIYGLYSGARFVFAGTPSGVTLAPEGGAHQSTVTSGLGITLPNLLMYEPCFALEVEWTLLEALRQCCDREHGRSTYLRLSTRATDQGLLAPALERLGATELRRDVLAGGYRLLEGAAECPDAEPGCAVYLAGSGAVIPEVAAAARLLQREGIAATALNLTSAERLYHDWRSARAGEGHQLARLIPPADRHLPIVTVHDGASHTLAWLGSVYGAPVHPIGVDEFGQSGARGDLYRHFGLEADQIAEVAFEAVDRMIGVA